MSRSTDTSPSMNIASVARNIKFVSNLAKSVDKVYGNKWTKTVDPKMQHVVPQKNECEKMFLSSLTKSKQLHYFATSIVYTIYRYKVVIA